MSATLEVRIEKYLGGTGTADGAVGRVLAFDATGSRDPSRDRRDLVIPAGPGIGPGIRRTSIPVEPGAYVVEAVLPSGDVASEQVTVGADERREVDLRAPESPREWLSWQQFIGNVPDAREVRSQDKARNEALKAAERANRKAAGDAVKQAEAARKAMLTRARTQTDRTDAFIRGTERQMAFQVGAKRVISLDWAPYVRYKARVGSRVGALPPGWRLADPVTPALPHLSPSGIRTRPAPAAPALPTWPTVSFIRHPVAALAGDAGGSAAWALLADPTTGRRPTVALAAEKPKLATRRLEQQGWRAYRFGGDGDLQYGEGATSGGDQLPRRYLLAATRGGPVELACLPVPWDAGPHGQVAVEVLVRRQPLPGEAVIAMSPEDPAVRSALGYMGTGSLANARLLFDKAKDMLFGKMINPLGASAGAYVLLATEHGPGQHEWHDWVRNLANWFDWLPDGMIQYGRLRLLRRETDADLAEARRAFFAAYDRGLPFYSLGLQWLVDGLSLLAPQDPDARERLANVQRVAWLANLQQPFTTLRLRD